MASESWILQLRDEANETLAETPKRKYYDYDPSLIVNAIFIGLFAVVTAGHLWLMVRKRTWYFLAFTIGCLFQAGGYGARVVAYTETPVFTLPVYVAQTLLILLAPGLYAASIYMVLGRLIRLLDADKHSPIRVNWLTKLFVLGDVLSFVMQGAGGALRASADTEDEENMGKYIIIGGLAVQLVFFGLFILATVLFHVRITREPTTRSLSVTAPWRQFILVLYATNALIMIRSIFRTVEYAMGRDGPLMQKEVYLFAFDSALMFLVPAIFLYWHPSQILVGYKPVATKKGEDLEGFPMVPAKGGYDSDGSQRTGGLVENALYDPQPNAYVYPSQTGRAY
ncbi:protein RTA1 [Parachaetomium inaequale]|uniref:Protein RTA1 n=1 Tax=Parachaetomium inaequale TaxID=2588326 RepID=A0AAN6PGW1_9PEZI|nr:protein RTA1 [Parachaetomium inaequale]